MVYIFICMVINYKWLKVLCQRAFLCVAKCLCIARSIPMAAILTPILTSLWLRSTAANKNQETKLSHFALMINAPFVTSSTERTMQNHIYIYISSSSSVICQTTGTKPFAKRFLHIVRSRASSFNWQYPLLSLRLSSSFLRLLPLLLVTSICPLSFLQ